MNKTILTIVMATLCLNFGTKAQEQVKPPPLKNQGVIGKVISASTGESLPGAVIKVTPTKQTIVSNDRGEFIISLVNGTYNLSVHYLNYKTKNITIQIPLKEKLIIALESDEQDLKEVEINAGYYTVKDRERTGSISRVTAKTIEKQPVNNVLGALIGRMPGVEIKQQNGVPGSNFSIQIRGRNSVRFNGNDPFYIVDGVPFISQSLSSSSGSTILGGLGSSPLSFLNPADIKSIEVLKDADATAIYGSRGANGVVLITTKTGRAGQTKFNVRLGTGYGQVPKMMNLLNTEQWLKMRYEAFRNDNVVPTTVNARDLKLWDTNRYTDWQKELIGGSASFNNAQISVSGGNERNQFLISGAYTNESTVFPGDFADKKYSNMMRLSHSTPDNKLKIDLLMNYLRDANNLLNVDLTQNSIELPPNAPAIYNANGSLNWENGTWTNPIGILNRKYKSKTDNFNVNTGLSYNALRNLTLKTNIGYNILSLQDIATSPTSSFNPAIPSVASSEFGKNSIHTFIAEPQLIYTLKIGVGKLTSLIGATYQESVQEKQSIFASGFTNDLLIENLMAAPDVFISSSDDSKYRYNAIFGRFNYDLKGRYLVNITARRDGSSRFGPDKQFANFGAIGAAWNFFEEKFIVNILPILSSGKIRGSVGITGSDQIGNYQYMDTYSSTTYSYQNISGLVPTQLVNQDYAWETNTKLEAAIELGFLGDKILFGVNAYRNRSSNQLVGLPLPGITGFNSVQYNLPAVVQNTGLEFELNTINVRNSSLTWTTSFNLTIPKNKLVSFPGLEASVYADTYKVGKPLTIVKKYKSTGVNSETGLYGFEDLDGNGLLSISKDGQFLKNIASKYYGGLNNSFDFRNFQFSFFFQFVKQTGFDYRYTFINAPGTRLTNQLVDVLDRWQNPGQASGIQQFTQKAPGTPAYGNAIRNSDEVIGDASYVRLKNISLSWTFPKRWLERIHVAGCGAFIQGQNLLTLTRYKGRDPETQNSGVLPPLRVFSLGIQLSL